MWLATPRDMILLHYAGLAIILAITIQLDENSGRHIGSVVHQGRFQQMSRKQGKIHSETTVRVVASQRSASKVSGRSRGRVFGVFEHEFGERDNRSYVSV